ncbi:hypothetical protein TeGR_g3131 [Tetraparma gracilis]|uniref:Glyceraldehyde 3-phosphate dehydrogenase NAD(P) binding domain-containing protein n=1 Tax=Tetraparma gracilis TaxID=2962635 RepID=A0ABQ6M5V4_9STRA|nr:hypothetical protein TeGR_g3131 [Tetraparma gracilis]
MSPPPSPPPTPVAINGFGRIGRLLFRYLHSDPSVRVVHVNDVCSLESAAYLARYDSVHGTWGHTVDVEGGGAGEGAGGGMRIDGGLAGERFVGFSSCADPARVPFPEGVAAVLDCTGKFLKVQQLTDCYLSPGKLPASHGGIRAAIISAPVKEAGAINIVLGCNESKLTGDHKIVTNASCTTNCLAPVVRVVKESFGIRHGCITTCHNVTGTQTLVDMPNTKKSDLRRARSGMLNLCPTSTGSATAIAEVYPELKGKLNGLAIRVPLLNASLTDCVFEVERPTTREEVNAALKRASEEGPLKGILGYSEEPLVSTDYTNDTRSSIIDALSTQVIDGTMVKIYAWYDNEAGYSKRMAELVNIYVCKHMRGEEPAYKYE